MRWTVSSCRDRSARHTDIGMKTDESTPTIATDAMIPYTEKPSRRNEVLPAPVRPRKIPKQGFPVFALLLPSAF